MADYNWEKPVEPSVNQSPPKRNPGWVTAFWAANAVMVLIGIGAFVLSGDNIPDPAAVPENDVNFGDAFITILPWLLGAIAFSILIGFLWLYILRVAPGAVVWGSMFLWPTLLIVGGLILIMAGTSNDELAALMVFGAILAIVGLVMISCICCWWSRIQLTVKVLGLASHIMDRNSSIFCYVLGLGAAFLPIGMMMSFFMSRAAYVGDYSFQALAESTTDFNSTLTPTTGNATVCDIDNAYQYNSDGQICAFATSPLGTAMMLYIFFMNLWTTISLQYVELAMIAGVVGTYYFHERDEGLQRNSVSASLKRAIGPSFGSIVYGAFILAAVKFIRTLIDMARQQAEGDRKGGNPALIIFLIILSCIVGCIEGWVEFLNKYTILHVALSGADFCGAARSMWEMLKRNFLSTYIVDTITGIVLGIGSFVFALVVTGIMYAIARAVLTDVIIIILFVFATFILSLLSISFFSDVIQQAMNAVFVCWTIDKDNNLNTRPEIHQTYNGFAVLSEEDARKRNPGWFKGEQARR